MGVLVLLGALGAAALVTTPSEPPVATAPLDSAALVAAIDYCVAVVEADMLEAAPLPTGPSGFERLDGRYGGQMWVAESPDGKAVLARPDQGQCSVQAPGFESADAAALFETREGYLPDNESSTAFMRLFDSGGVRAGWSPLDEGVGLKVYVNNVKFQPEDTASGRASAQEGAPAQDAVPREALGDALAFCLAVGEAERLGEPAVPGPAHFQENIGPYGHRTWKMGVRYAPSSIGVSASENLCTIVANGAPPHRVTSWMRGRTDYAVVGDKVGHFARRVGDGWVQIGWAAFGDETTMIMVTSRKGEERPDMF